jgi:hypothetical protein
MGAQSFLRLFRKVQMSLCLVQIEIRLRVDRCGSDVSEKVETCMRQRLELVCERENGLVLDLSRTLVLER